MKAKSFVITSAVALVFAATLYAADVKLEGVKCILNPKSAAKADKCVEYKEGKVYFCCDNCPKKFDKDKHAVKANHQLVATKQYVSTGKCPLTGRPTNAAQTVKVAGVEVAPCCPGCKGKVTKAKGEEKAKLIFVEKAFKKGFKVAKKDD